MINRKPGRVLEPFGHNPHINVFDEYTVGQTTLAKGDVIKFTGARGKFKFIKYVVNAERGVEWLDVFDVKTHEYRSFYASRLKHKVQKKRTRRKAFQIEQAVRTGNSTGHCSKCRCELTTDTASPSILRRGSGYCRSCMSVYLESRKK